ncbi:MAG: hypothetical protein GX815_00365 [Clostridiales bacterium]|nr:hypothetical protein [Clostridiales bacterium]
MEEDHTTFLHRVQTLPKRKGSAGPVQERQAYKTLNKIGPKGRTVLERIA